MDAVSQIKSNEGFRAEAYPDQLTGGAPWTIGYGRTDGVKPGDVTTQDAEDRFVSDKVGELSARLTRAFAWFAGLNEPRQAVLIGMAYNMGMGGLLGFKGVIDSLLRGDYAEASVRMLQSVWAKQVHERSARLSQQMRTGEWVMRA